MCKSSIQPDAGEGLAKRKGRLRARGCEPSYRPTPIRIDTCRDLSRRSRAARVSKPRTPQHLHHRRSFGQIAIAHAAPTCSTSRDFVPWRFSDASRQRMRIGSSCRRPNNLHMSGHQSKSKYERELSRYNHSEVSCFQRQNNNSEYAGLDIL